MKNDTQIPQDQNSTDGTDEPLDTAACYALVIYAYDYYESEETLAVSFDPDKLKNEYDTLDHLYSDEPLVECDDHQKWSGRGAHHWVIEPVKFLA